MARYDSTFDKCRSSSWNVVEPCLLGPTRCVDVPGICASMQHMWSPPLTEVMLQHFEHDNAIEIHNRIMFDSCLGLPHV